jgi:hypothetical protein
MSIAWKRLNQLRKMIRCRFSSLAFLLLHQDGDPQQQQQQLARLSPNLQSLILRTTRDFRQKKKN